MVQKADEQGTPQYREGTAAAEGGGAQRRRWAADTSKGAVRGRGQGRGKAAERRKHGRGKGGGGGGWRRRERSTHHGHINGGGEPLVRRVGGEGPWRHTEVATAYNPTRPLAWLHDVHIIKGPQSARAVRDVLPCRLSALAVASRL